jgi:Tol biopolymer transport system component/DNA-binding winged helix-turn-helix (wHTH) protein
MAQPATNRRIVRFALFELDLDARELRKSGVKIKLQEQPFQILAMLLKRPGEIVTREELQKRLWPQDTFVDFDLSLNSAVKKLRQALGDDSANPRFIETLYRRGYRFIGQSNGLKTEPELVSVSSNTSQENVESQFATPQSSTRRFRFLVWTVPASVILIAALLWLLKPPSAPRIIRYTQITDDGLTKGKIVTDGQRLYFAEFQSENFVPVQVSALGGETSVVPTPFPEAYPPDIAGDGSALLVAAFTGTKEGPLFSLPLPAGSPQRLTNAFGHSATWSRDRGLLVFGSGSEIYEANGNGAEPRKLATVDGVAVDLRLSPDGHRLRFAVLAPNSDFSSLWEINRDGSNLHPLLPGWNTPPRECCGNWTPDGKYYVFQSVREAKTNLWLLPERATGLRDNKPLQLTNGPLNFSDPVVSKDGKKIFAVGTQARSEVVRYKGESDFVPYLGGISATDLSFSPDGKSVAYVSVPEGILWRSKIDGTQRLQLTESSLHAALPRWSPNGKQIVFMGQAQSSNWRAYVIASDGGVPRDLAPSAQAGFDPGWSPDGKSVVLTLNEAGNPGFVISGPGIALVDLQSGKISLLPGAAQLFSPRWSPEGRYIAALTVDSSKVVLFDFTTQQWTDLASTTVAGYHTWSHNGQYLYFDSSLNNDPAFLRVRISDRKLERVASLKGLRRFSGQFGSWTGLAPDDSLLLVRDTSSQEIYALDWQAP